MNTHNSSDYEHDMETINANNKSPSPPPIQFKSEAANIYYNAMRVKSATPSNLQQQQQQTKKKKKQEKKKIRWNKKTKKGKFNHILPTTTTSTVPPTTTTQDTPRTTSYYESKMAKLLKKHRTFAAEHTKEMNKSPSDLANDMTIQEKVSSSSKVVDEEKDGVATPKKKKAKTSIKKKSTRKHMTLDEFYDDEPVVESEEAKKIVTTPSQSPVKKSGIDSLAVVDESPFLLDMLEEEKEKKVVRSEKVDVEESNFIADMIKEEKNKVVSSEKLNDRQEDIFTDIGDDKKPVVNIIAGDESNCSSISESTSPSGKVVKRFDVDKSIEKFEAAKRKHSSSSTTISKKKIKEQALEKMKKAIRFAKSNNTSSPQDDTAISSTGNEAFSPNLTGEFTNIEETPPTPLKGYEHRLAQALATSDRPETAVAFLKEEDIPLSPQFIEWINKKESSLWTMNKEEFVQYWLDVLDTLLSHQDMTEIIVDTVGEVFVSVNDYFSPKEEDKVTVDKDTLLMPVTEDDEKQPIKKKMKPKSVLKSSDKRSFKPKETIDAWHKIDAFLNRTSNMQTDDTTASDLKTELLRLAKLEEEDDSSIKTELLRLAKLEGEDDDSSIKTEQCTKSEDSIVTECPDKEDEASLVTESPNNKDDKSIVTETPSEAKIAPIAPVNAEMAEKPEVVKESVATEELPKEDWRKLLKALLREVEKEEVEDKQIEELHEFISNEQDVLDSYERKASTTEEAKSNPVETSTALVTTNTMDAKVADNTKTPKHKKKKKEESVKKKPKVKELKVWEKTEDPIVDTSKIDKMKKDNKKDKANQLMAQELKVWEKDASDNSTAASSNLLVKGDASLQTAATGSTVDTNFSVTSCNGLRVEILRDVREITSGIKQMILCKCNEYTPNYSQDISNRYA